MLFIDIEAESLLKKLIGGVQDRMKARGIRDWALYPGDERRMFLEDLAPVLQSLFANVNQACLNRLLDSAYGVYLDAIGSLWDCERLAPAHSTCKVKFSIAKTRTVNTLIPAGTKVSADNVIYFETKTNATILAGEKSVEVETVSSVGGSEANNYEIGDITGILDIVPYVNGVTNTTAPEGADDGEPYPDKDDGSGDEHYRARIKLSRTVYSTCGASLSYKYFAQSANATIKDVKVISPDQEISGYKFGVGINGEERTATVYADSGLEFSSVNELYINTDTHNVYRCVKAGNAATAEWILCMNMQNALSAGYIHLYAMCTGKIEAPELAAGSYAGGCLPNNVVLKEILTECSADSRRPMGDVVSALAPDLVSYDIELTYYTNIAEEKDAYETIEGVDGAVQRYIEWQCSEIGKHINPDKLEALCIHPNWGNGLTGALRVDVVSPAHKDLTETQLARWSGEIKVTKKLVSDY